MITPMKSNRRLRFLVLFYFRGGAKTTNFYKNEIFSGYTAVEVRNMLYSLVTVGDIQRIDASTTNGAGYMLSSHGESRLSELAAEFGEPYKHELSEATG